MPKPRVTPQKGAGRNGQRSRKGCPECRSRRIKCDETRPECGQCVKGGRTCRIIDGLFRPHLMSMPTESASQSEGSPKPQSPRPQTHSGEAQVASVPAIITITNDVNLAVDSPRTPISPNSTLPLASPARSRGSIPICGLLAQSSLPESTPEIIATPLAQSLPSGKHHTQNTPTVTCEPPASISATSISAIPSSITEESDQDRAEIGFFLRLFADGGGQWMDICSGQRSYFSHYVVQLASQSPLVRYSACALAAKQIGQMQEPTKATAKSPRSQIMTSTLLDFEWYGAKYYEKAILLMAHQISHNASTTESHLSPREIYQSPESGQGHLDSLESTSSALRILAACILCSYEDLSATMRAWTGHLDGISKLLRPHLDPTASPLNFYRIPQPKRALEVSFWYFALNDMLNSLTLRQASRIDTEDIALWQRMGLPLDISGKFLPDSIEEAHQELIFFKALLRLLCKISSQRFTDSSQWTHIDMEFTEWHNNLPLEYLSPISQTLPVTQKDTNSVLPETWFGSDVCAIAMAFYHMARILLLVNQPQEAFLAMQPHNDLLGSYNALQRNLSHHAMEILPVAHGSSGKITVQKYMLQPLYVAGRCLSSWNERQIVIERLRHIENTLGLATEYCVKGLAEEWGIPYESLVSKQ